MQSASFTLDETPLVRTRNVWQRLRSHYDAIRVWMPVRIRRYLPMCVILAQDLPKPNSTIERMVATR